MFKKKKKSARGEKNFFFRFDLTVELVLKAFPFHFHL